MKSVTSGFKTAIASIGRQLDAKVTVGSTTYQGSNIVSINPHYDGALLRSVMKCMDIELDNVSALASTTIDNVQFGLLVGSAYEYISFGKCKYRKEDAAYSEETNSLSVKAYDLMLDSMIPYDLTGLTYPMTVAAYLQAICTRLGWVLGTTGAFVNSTMQIEAEKYDNSDTFRDVLDDIAEVAAGTIAFKPDNKLYILYPTETGETIDCSNLSSLKIGKKFGPVNSIVLARTPQEDNIYAQDAASVLANGLTEIRIENNQIMDSHREDFTAAILAQLNGLTYYFYELESFGIAYMDLCDRFTLKQQDNTAYSTLFLRDDLEITQGIHETALLEESEAKTTTDYKAASTTDKALKQTILRVDKQAQEISARVSKGSVISEINQSAETIKIAAGKINFDAISTIGIPLCGDEIKCGVAYCGYLPDLSSASPDNVMQQINASLIRLDAVNTEMLLKVNRGNIIAEINMTPEQIKIAAGKIALEGYTTINGNFAVDTSGNVTVKGSVYATDFKVDNNIHIIDGGSSQSGLMWVGGADEWWTEGKPYIWGDYENETLTVSAGNSCSMSSKASDTYVNVQGDGNAFLRAAIQAKMYGHQLTVLGTGEYDSLTEIYGYDYIRNCVHVGSKLAYTYFRMRDTYAAYFPSGTYPIYLGAGDAKWEAVYANTGTIQTSDRNKKNTIDYDVSKYEALFSLLKPCSYKLNDGDSGRTHTGFISQDIEESFAEAGLTSMDLGAFIKSPRYMLDADGNATTEIEGYDYAIRYEELIALNTHMIQKMQIKINELEARLNA